MPPLPPADSAGRRPLRLWPGVLIVILQLLGRFVVPLFFPEAAPFGFLGSVAGALLIILWWAFFSRAAGIERWGGILLMVVSLAVTSLFLDPSIATGMMGMLFYLYSIPLMSMALVGWALLTRNLSIPVRRATLVATILLASGGWIFVRTGGFTGDIDSDFSWRWAKTPEELLLAQAENQRPGAEGTVDSEALAAEASWPGYRGPHRDSVLPGVRIGTDWAASPPVELWRQPVGPGWASFAVLGDVFYTQEQRGEEEAVSCYRLDTGELVWLHRDPARFWESNAGAGPRSTPTLSGGRVYSSGATGILNALDAADGTAIWSRNVAEDTGVEVPLWGLAASPVVVDGVVITAARGTLAAYDAATGDFLWQGPDGGGSYSSPHLMTLDGVPQVLLMSRNGAVSVDPATGTVLWEYSWPGGERIVQPARTAGGDLLFSEGETRGLRRVGISREGEAWKLQEIWTTNRLKPYFNDFVVHEGHAYGFDGNILAAIDLADGERKWKGGRYGNGQLLLLADQDLLLVLAEGGDLALVKATPEGFTELSRFPAIEGKTWNHPVLVDGVLLVRNAEEMAAFRLR